MEFLGKHYKYIFFLVIIIVLGGILFSFRPVHTELISESQFFMDTLVTVKVVAEKNVAEQAIDLAFNEMKEWADKLDRFKVDSIVYKINHHKRFKVETEVLNLFKEGQYYADMSKGSFDFTIAPLLDLWGFGQQDQHVPPKSKIENILKKIDYKKLELIMDTSEVFLPDGMSIDLGGMAKGFIVDKGVEVLRSLGITSAYINAGGNIRVIGNKSPGRPWHIGIRNPRNYGDIFQDYILEINQGSLATSGDYERYFIEDGTRYSHLLDPRIGYPAREMQSATIYAPRALEADILSTTVFILGWDEGKKLINNLKDVEGFLVKKDDIWFSDGLKNYFNK